LKDYQNVQRKAMSEPSLLYFTAIKALYVEHNLMKPVRGAPESEQVIDNILFAAFRFPERQLYSKSRSLGLMTG
jgi:hypothetical protein